MPKIIENLESRLITEAHKQIEQSGYSALTVRSVAKACGVGVGTVYNYFPSKEHLLTAFLLRDWDSCIATIVEVSDNSAEPLPVLRCIYHQLHQFNRTHQHIFKDETAVAAVAASFSRVHAALRTQLARPLRKFCSSDFQSEFIIEALFTWSSEGKSFEDIFSIIRKLL